MAHFPKHFPVFLQETMMGMAANNSSNSNSTTTVRRGLHPRKCIDDYYIMCHDECENTATTKQSRYEYDQGPPPKRARGSDGTTATFELCSRNEEEENYCTPKAEAGVITLMGLYHGTANGGGHLPHELREKISDPALAIYDAYLILKEKLGYEFPEISAALQKNDEDETLTAWQVISDRWTDGSFAFVDQNGVHRGAIEATFDNPAWLYIRCEAEEEDYDDKSNEDSFSSNKQRNNSVADTLQELLRDKAALAQIRHEKVEIGGGEEQLLPNGYVLEAETGADENCCGISNIGTIFKLYKQQCFRDGQRGTTKKLVLVGKAFCSYCNTEMGTSGPTLELLEIAKEYQGRGLGSAMLDEMEIFYSKLFRSSNLAGLQVIFSVCHVSNAYALRWFLDRGFSGIGEELHKVLY